MLREIDADPPDALWCLGDLVGYGPRPNEVTAIVRERTDICLVGNHDLAALDAIDTSDFAHDAAASARWTRDALSADTRAYLTSLAPSGAAQGVQLFHASARDPVWVYVLTEEAAVASLQLTSAPVVLVGHSHVALALLLAETQLAGGLAPAGAEVDLAAGRWLLNPGSVGQPRDGDARAAYLLIDFDRRFASFRRVAYPVAEVQREIREAALPDALAERLALGT